MIAGVTLRATKLALIAVGGVSLCLDGLAEEVSAWPLFRGSADMRGVASEALKAPLKLAWSADVGDSVLATPVIAGGKVYVGAEDGKFACFDLADGKKLWQYLAEDKIEGTACIAGKAVVFGSGDGLLHAVDRESGEMIWTYETDGEILGGANLYHSEKDAADYVLIGSYDNNLHCVHLGTGKAKWTYETENAVNGAPGVHEGKIYFGGCDAQIYSIDAETGKTGSSMDAENYIANSIVVVDGIAYVAHHGNRVAAFDLGAEKRLWEFGERDFPFFASPAVSADSVFAAGRDKRLYRIDRTSGEAVWEFKTGSGIDSSPVVSGDTVFVGSGDGSLYAIDIPGGEKVWSYEIGEDIRSSPAIADGKLVIGCDDGKVYAFSSAAE